VPTIPGPVDADGNITVPAEGGAVIPVKEQDNQVPPVQQDISSLAMKFLVKGRIDLTPVADPNDPLGRLIVITETLADQLSTKGHDFQLLDMTDPLVPIPLWYGTIRRGS
jgi:hypothetical protein